MDARLMTAAIGVIDLPNTPTQISLENEDVVSPNRDHSWSWI